ncbi:uncharacterized protein LOC116265279 [Nymphaea colorata]|uniref:uncharacterized protein LOC116265279 n=1 Tax=Nymphaea colorata TaxID=210225 RepID=UPI00129E926B|nr:uncharacterized protein LOC116265279 [Nymphaea colorata]
MSPPCRGGCYVAAGYDETASFAGSIWWSGTVAREVPLGRTPTGDGSDTGHPSASTKRATAGHARAPGRAQPTGGAGHAPGGRGRDPESAQREVTVCGGELDVAQEQPREASLAAQQRTRKTGQDAPRGLASIARAGAQTGGAEDGETAEQYPAELRPEADETGGSGAGYCPVDPQPPPSDARAPGGLADGPAGDASGSTATGGRAGAAAPGRGRSAAAAPGREGRAEIGKQAARESSAGHACPFDGTRPPCDA